MKISFGIIVVAAILLLTGCNKEALKELEPVVEFDFSGEIVRVDYTLCPCCGGFVATIIGSNDDFRIQKVPADFQSILDTIEFPIKVNLNYTELDPCSSYSFINVDEIEILE